MLWVTDPHLNFLPPGGSRQLGEKLAYLHPEETLVVITGDIAEAPSVRKLLSEFHEGWGGQTAFVLGNHDYYFGSFAKVKHDLRKLPNGLVWLDHSAPLQLDDTTALVGHEGWFDGMHGAARRSRVVMSDFDLIADLKQHYNPHLWAWPNYRQPMLDKLKVLGETAAKRIKPKIEKALTTNDTIVIATHFPPFPKSAVHQGQVSDPHWMPWFSCGAMGQMLETVADAHQDKRFLTLCGHSHSPGKYKHRDNLHVMTGWSVYSHPKVAAVIDIPIEVNAILLQGPNVADFT